MNEINPEKHYEYLPFRGRCQSQLDDIYQYTLETLGEGQVDHYITDLFAQFERIAARTTPWSSVPDDFEVAGPSPETLHLLENANQWGYRNYGNFA